MCILKCRSKEALVGREGLLALRTQEGRGTGTDVSVCVSGIESNFQVKSEERDIFKAIGIPIHNIKILSFCVYDHKSP